MAGEMPYIDPVTGETPDGEVYTLHAAIAKAVGGTIQPFDTYQGPYVVVGKDVRMGERPYQLAVQGVGVIRLWVGSDAGWPDYLARVYREDTDTLSEPFEAYGPHAEEGAVGAALSLMVGEVIPAAEDWDRLRVAAGEGK